MAGHSTSRRLRAAAAAILVTSVTALATTAAAASARQPLNAHTASRTATVIIHPAAVGRYEVIIWVRSRTKHKSLVKVYISGQKMQTVRANPWWGARVYYMLNLSGKKVTVHTVNQAPAVQVRASLILKKAASSAPQVTTAPAATPTPPTPTPTPTPPPPASTPYSSHTSLIWQDVFSGPAGSAPNPSLWKYDTGPSCGDPGCSVDVASTANASLTGGNQLAITALQSGSNITAAQIETPALFHVGEEIDANIKFPAGQGLWGGFWLVEANTPGICMSPNCGELDVVEVPEMGPIPTDAYFTVHGPVNPPGPTGTQQWGVRDTVGDLSAGFHTYGIIWNPGSIQYTIDGTVYATLNPNMLVAGSTWMFDSGTYSMLLDMAVGGWPGPPTAATQFPATMLVNWVRVYQ